MTFPVSFSRMSSPPLFDTAPPAFKLVNRQPKLAVAVRRGPTAPKSVKVSIGKSLGLGSVIKIGAVFTNMEKRTSTGKSLQFRARG